MEGEVLVEGEVCRFVVVRDLTRADVVDCGLSRDRKAG